MPNANGDETASTSSSNLLLPLLPALVTSNKKTLILDLDHTLVFATTTPVQNSDYTFHSGNGTWNVFYRPFLDMFLEAISKQQWEVCVFTASMPNYANPIIDSFDKNKVIQHRFYRMNCDEMIQKNPATNKNQAYYRKNITKLGRHLDNCIIIDNDPFAFSLHPENGVQIKAYSGPTDFPQDAELLPLISILNKLVTSDESIPNLLQNMFTPISIQ